MLELPNFGNMTTCTIKFDSRVKMLFLTSRTKIISKFFYFETFISKYLFRPRVANFANIIKISIKFNKRIFKDSKS